MLSFFALEIISYSNFRATDNHLVYVVYFVDTNFLLDILKFRNHLRKLKCDEYLTKNLVWLVIILNMTVSIYIQR